MRRILALLTSVVLAVVVSTDSTIASEFAQEPKAARVADHVQISFAVSEPTDAEIAILDADGKVVRHLAAGRLGDNPPAAFNDGLSQKIAWDLCDDSGKPASGGRFKVRVRLGLGARFDKVIGWSGQYLDGVRGLVCGSDGTLYVLFGSALYAHRQTTLITAFDRNGRYLRQAFPGPANLPTSEREGWPHLKLDDDREVPVVFHLLSRCTYPGAVFGNRVLPAVTSDGRLVMLGGAATGSTIKHADIREGRRLIILGTDGSVPEDFQGPVVVPEEMGGFGQVAVSPDDRYAYVAGLFEPGKNGRGLCHVVWRVALDGAGPCEVYAGKLYEPGDGKDGLNDPQGLAVDKAGNVHVADYGNDRVAVFKPNGQFIGEISVQHPDTVRVSHRTGAVYVLCLEERKKPITDGHYYVAAHNWKPKCVVKFRSLEDPVEIASLDTPHRGNYGGGAFMALDDTSNEAVLWIGGTTYGGGPVYRVVDKGSTLELVGTPISDRIADDATPLPFFGDVAVSGDKIIARHPTFSRRLRADSLVFNANTGEPEEPFLPKRADGRSENYWTLVYGEMTSGKDGRLYVHSDSTLLRYDPNGDPAIFESTGSHILDGFKFDRHTHLASTFATAGGDIYTVARQTEGGQALDEDVLCVQLIRPDGKTAKDCLISAQAVRIGGLAVDSRGNVYMGAQVTPRDQRIPSCFAGKLPADSSHSHPSIAYSQCGAIVKFPPGGGEIKLDPQGAYIGHRQKANAVSMTGRIIARGGLVAGKYDKVGLGCNCEVSRFDIDGYDRLYVPDVLRHCVLVLDSEGNEITRFGSYGNMDSRGPESPVPQPAIAFGWPLTARYANGRVIVADLVNCRLVAAKLEHAASAECAVE